MSKIAAITTFPNESWEKYAKTGVKSFMERWPKDIPLMIQVDPGEGQEENIKKITSAAEKRADRNVYVIDTRTEEHEEFVERNKDVKAPEGTKSGHLFKYKYTTFCHKVFAQYAAMESLEDDTEYLIWFDADVITEKEITHDNIKQWIKDGCIASYLGRKDWPTSETGFIIYDLKNGGREFIKRFHEMYVKDEVLKFDEWTDAATFDRVREEFTKVNKKDVFFNLSPDVPGRDVFAASPLGAFMKHYKGPQKNAGLTPEQPAAQHGNGMTGGTFNTSNMQIVTKNCVPDETIQGNIRENLRLIENWLPVCKENKESIVIASAGPSLNPQEILEWYHKGVKVVAVKHALKKLKEAGITPWACILLDPRPHVGEFIEYPDLETKYFVASMVDPEVTRHLIKCGAQVYGYHAAVGAKENECIPLHHRDGKHILIQGGSATATRGISLLEALGFSDMHLYAYDCCYFNKPDLNEKKENGRFKYEEVTLGAQTWGGKEVERTFWTEGQFLAQVQEFEQFYLMKEKVLTLSTYGEGIIPWMHKHRKRYDEWKKKHVKESRGKRKGASNINKWLELHETGKSGKGTR